MLSEPQRRRGDAHLPAVAVAFAEIGKGLLGALSVTETYQGEQEPGSQWPSKRVRSGQLLGGPERGQRIGRPGAAQLKLAADVVRAQRRRRVRLRYESPLRALNPGVRLAQPSLPGERGSKRIGGETDKQIGSPAVPLG